MRAIMKKGGFTLIEVLIATLLIGLAIVSLVVASASFTKGNASATDLSTAEFLIEQVRERSVSVNYNDLSSLRGTFSPPIDANGGNLNSFAAFNEQIAVEDVCDSNFGRVVADSNFIRINVKVFLNSKQISSASWLRANIGN